MRFFKSIRAWWRGLFRKRHFNMLNATDNSEEWHMHLSPASIFAAFLSFVLLLFILILSLVAYSPILELLPGYRTEADRSRESLVQNIIRLDSMERMMNDMLTYNQHIALIMEGKTPVARTLATSDSTRTSKVLVMPSPEDSILRAQMEGDGPYARRSSWPNPWRGSSPTASTSATAISGYASRRRPATASRPSTTARWC